MSFLSKLTLQDENSSFKIINYLSLFSVIFKSFNKEFFKVLTLGLLSACFNFSIAVLASYLFSHLYATPSMLIACLLLLIGMTILTYIIALISRQLNVNFIMQIMPDVIQHLLVLPLQHTSNYLSGDLSQRVNDYELALTNLLKLSFDILFGVISLVLLLIYMTYDNSKLTVWYLLIILVFFMLKMLILPNHLCQQQLQYVERGKLSAYLNEVLLQIHKIRSGNAHATVGKKWLMYLFNIKILAEKSMQLEVLLLVLETSLPVLLMLPIYISVYFNINTDKVLLLQFLLCAGQFNAIFAKFSQDIIAVMHFMPGLQRLKPLLTLPYKKLLLSQITSSEIVFSQVSFMHPDSQKLILNELNLTIAAGEFVTIIGASGSGKSTLIKLLLNMEQATQGNITVGGENIQFVSRNEFGVVMQNSNVFPGTILANLSINHTLSLDEAWELAAHVGLADDIERMPMKMHTIISDNAGESISGGQKQKILIARALALKPKILLLDEATSALDNDSQALVYEYLRGLNITRVVIAHRVSGGMGRVMELRGGRLHTVISA